MDRDEAIRRAEIAMAWARGEEVQWRTNAEGFEWMDIARQDSGVSLRPAFFDPGIDWRIKPKPLECWVWVPNRKTAELRACGGWVEESQLPVEPDYINGGGRWVRMVQADD